MPASGAAPLLGLPEERWVVPALVLNFHPSAYLHASWLAGMEHREIVERLASRGEAAASLARYLNERLELDGDWCDDFSTPFARLALMDGDAQMRLYLHVGLALRSDEIRGRLLGSEVRALKAALGEPAYAFAVRTTPLLGRIPEFPFEPETADPLERLSLIGARYAWSRMAPKPPEGLLRRALYKLPASWKPPLEGAWDDGPAVDDTGPVTAPEAGGDPDRKVGLPRLVDRILREVLPEWRPLFD